MLSRTYRIGLIRLAATALLLCLAANPAAAIPPEGKPSIRQPVAAANVCSSPAGQQARQAMVPSENAKKLPLELSEEAALDVACLTEAYPGFFTGAERDPDGSIWLLTCGNERILYDDGREKSPEELMDNADIEDSMRLPYPLEPARPTPGVDEDPGRIRSYALMTALYGSERKSVEAKLVKAPLHTSSLRIAARLQKPLARMHEASQRLLAAKPELAGFYKGACCQYWRVIAGTQRLSAHSWGIAIDLNPEMGPYWQWSHITPHPDQKTWPPEIVALFEENGFIWGGKWYHYDLMHFEYRPELILKARKLAGRS